MRRFETDGRIRNLHWWDRPQLLLTGCMDAKLIAFHQRGTANGRSFRKWTPPCTQAAKQVLV